MAADTLVDWSVDLSRVMATLGRMNIRDIRVAIWRNNSRPIVGLTNFRPELADERNIRKGCQSRPRFCQNQNI